MNKQTKWGKSAATLCLEFGEEDGIDPRYLTRSESRKPSSRKTMQLCKEAGRVVSLVLAGEARHPLLGDLCVLSVTPEQDGQALCLTVAHAFAAHHVSGDDVMNALKQSQGLFRCALAHAVNRKKIPLLRFRYAGSIGKEGV